MKKRVLTNFWGTTGFKVPKLIHLLKELVAGSALKTKQALNDTSLKIFGEWKKPVGKIPRLRLTMGKLLTKNAVLKVSK